MSGPVPSPSMKGTIGRSGTCSLPSVRVIAAPSLGEAECDIVLSGSFRARPLRRHEIFTEDVENLVEKMLVTASRAASIGAFERFAPFWCALAGRARRHIIL